MAGTDSTTRWKVSVFKPRKGETSWRCIPRRRVSGKREERGELRADDEAKARELARFYEARINAGVKVDANNPTMDALFALRIDALQLEDASPNTVKNYKAARKGFAKTLGLVGALDVTKGSVLRAQGELRKTRGETTTAQYTAQAAAVFRWAQDCEWVAAERVWPRLGTRKAKCKRTKKRPWADEEVAELLLWVEGYHNGWWLPIVQLLADTGARVNAVLGLQEDDVNRGPEPSVTFRRQWVGGPGGEWRKLKTAEDEDDVRKVEIPSSTAALLPKGNEHGLLFPHRNDPERPCPGPSVRSVLKKAAKALELEDAHLLDTHGLRRAWVSTARELGITNKAGMAVTGHHKEDVYLGYDRRGRRGNTRTAVEAVHAARLHPNSTPSGTSVNACKALGQTQDSGRKARPEPQPLASKDPSPAAAVEPCPPESGHVRTRMDTIGWKLNPTVSRLSQWADEDPEALRRLLTDEVLRRQVLAAIEDVVGHAEGCPAVAAG